MNKPFNTLLVASSFFVAPLYAVPSVAVNVVEQAPLVQTVALNGTLRGKGDVDLTMGTSGKLAFVAEPGAVVKQGDAVARIEMLPLELEAAEQRIMIRRAEVNLTYQRQELERLKKLAKTSSAAANQVDLVQSQHDLALTDIELAKVKLKQIEDRMARATVVAPFDGIISKRFLLAGSDASRADKLVHFIDINNLEVRFYAPVKYLVYAEVGQKVTLSSGSFDNLQFADARVTAVIPATDSRSQTFEVRAKLLGDKNKGWASGQLVDVDFKIEKTAPSLLVERDALILRKAGVHVVKIQSDNKALQVAVAVGQGQGSKVEVRPLEQGALKQGDKVATRGAERLTSGQEVLVQQ
ncbi:efflux RND transporter periplasmic adaptor subunit [Pseudoalteromonas piratica]|uniref:efflux RND transporter periplasmic adaptor subunit n=1 Tax=Pseudoalteromonas piratica TaxID=1348114 RepID=UPI00068E7BF1|nr:efflux RND transporter periplasmic adaptor subunit [Pseudoalteromonas piratica]